MEEGVFARHARVVSLREGQAIDEAAFKNLIRAAVALNAAKRSK